MAGITFAIEAGETSGEIRYISRHRGDEEKAVASWREAQNLFPGGAQTARLLADKLRKMGDLEGALEAYRTGLVVDDARGCRSTGLGCRSGCGSGLRHGQRGGSASLPMNPSSHGRA